MANPLSPLPKGDPLLLPKDFQSSWREFSLEDPISWWQSVWDPGPAGSHSDSRSCPPGSGGLGLDLSYPTWPHLSHDFVPQVWAMRLSFTGELGWELHIPKVSCVTVHWAMMAMGANHGLINAGYHAIHSLSTEKSECWVWTARGGLGRQEGSDTQDTWRLRSCLPSLCRHLASFFPHHDFLPLHPNT